MILTRLDATVIEQMKPGQHVVVLSGDPVHALEGRQLGLELRDTILVQSVGQTEFAFLFRKELDGTVAENVLRYGHGGLNIDGTRVRHSSAADLERHKAGVEAIRARGGQMANSWKNSSDLSGASEVTSAGRWPTNVVLVHSPECRPDGTRRVPGHKGYPNGPGGNKNRTVYGKYAEGWGVVPHAGHADEDGTETVTAWECQEGCPVAALDQQSGYLHGSGNKSSTSNEPGNLYEASSYHISYKGQANRDYGSAGGGASRFFPQFAGRADLLDWLGKLLGESG